MFTALRILIAGGVLAAIVLAVGPGDHALASGEPSCAVFPARWDLVVGSTSGASLGPEREPADARRAAGTGPRASVFAVVASLIRSRGDGT
jgi:hypothetical protein